MSKILTPKEYFDTHYDPNHIASVISPTFFVEGSDNREPDFVSLYGLMDEYAKHVANIAVDNFINRKVETSDIF